MMRPLRLFHDEGASAAAEMALVLPILLTLMFGAFELGNYFQSEHVLQKAVRDAARYAARLPIKDTSGTVNYDCSASTPTVDSTAQTDIQEVARFSDPSGTTDGKTSRLSGWTDDTMATVTLSCDSSSSDSYVNNGVYADFPDSGAVPVVTVTATVPYKMLFGSYVFGTATLNLNATSQAAVIGA